MARATARSITSLPRFEALPSNCTSYPVTDNRFAPTIKVGQFVVVDTLQQYQSPGALLLIKTPDGFRSIERPPVPAPIVGTIIGVLESPAAVISRTPSPALVMA
jgi:hypothetical protein